MPDYNQDSYQDERLQYHLQVQASQIQNVLDVNGTPQNYINGVANKNSFTFSFQSPISAGLEKLKQLKEEFKKALGIEGLRLTTEDGQLQLEVTRPFEPAVSLLDLMSRIKNPILNTAILGFAENGMVAHHNFAQSATPNILISGAENAGKTELLRTMAASLALTNRQADAQFIIIDPIASKNNKLNNQSDKLRPLNYLPHMLTDVVSRQTEISEILQFLVREMNYRSEHLFKLPRIIVFIDQTATVLERGGRKIKEAINRIAERGASSGIHLVLATRQPDSSHFSPHLLTNLQSRIVGWEKETEMSDAIEAAYSRTTDLLGQGDFLLKGAGNHTRFQAAYIDDYDLHMGLSKLYQKRPILLAHPLSTRVQLHSPSAVDEGTKSFMLEDGVVKVA